MLKLHIHTLPYPTPMAIIFLNTAEHDGRYSEGNHTEFSESYVIHAPSKLKPQPLRREFWGSITLSVVLGVVLEAIAVSIVILPI
jgi:hypothetical protein